HQNLGFSKANNQGISIAQGKYLLLLNSDTIVKKGSLEKMVEFLQAHPEVAAVSPQLVNPDGSKQINYYMKFPSLLQILFYHTLLFRWLSLKTPLRHLVFSFPKKKPFSVHQLPGAALMTRREVFAKTGGLPEEYSLFFEDVDWCYQVTKMKLGKLIVLPKVKIIHFGGGSWEKWRKKDPLSFYRQYFSSLLLFVKRNYGRRIYLYRGVLGMVFLINFLLWLIRGNFKKAGTQILLLKWVLLEVA
ncbi:glycosyltransferase family 2 protein, partial [bacterium]|nr:glycosyltransferase family 2 protein [bacterium]